MKKLISILTVAALAFAVASPAFAAPDKGKGKGKGGERTVRGLGVCGKCALKQTDGCSNAIKVSRKNKDGEAVERIIWLADNEVAKGAHGKFFCKGENPVAVKGTIQREGKGKDAKVILTAAEIGAPKGKKKKN